MIDSLKTEGRKYSLIHFKDKIDKDNETQKQIQIEKIKKVFKDNDKKENNKDNDEFNKQLYSLDFNSKNIESFQNFSLIKNSLETEKFEPDFQKKKEKFSSKKNIRLKDNTIINNNNFRDNLENKTDEKIISKNNVISEIDKKNDINENILNVTQDQMKIFDDGVNKLYNDHKNDIKLKIFQINHPYLHNIKLINNNIESTTSLMTKEQRMLPILHKQKLILKKIQENNFSRNNSSISRNNNDSIINSTINKDNNLNKLFFNRSNKINNINNVQLYSPRIHKTFDYNQNILDNYSSSENGKNYNSSEKINLNTRKNISFKPYTLAQYKNKYENNFKKLGGLGANLGGEDWDKRQKLFERKKHYSDFIKNDDEFYNFNKKKIKLINKKNEDAKTVLSKKESEFSGDSNSRYKYQIFKTENNIINNNELKLPLINQRFNSNNKILKKRRNKNNQIFNINQEHELEGSEKDLKQLIQQYEEYNEKFKL